jgi:hypothetical protein
MIGIAGFAIVIYFSWRARRRPDAHKRVVLSPSLAGLLAQTLWRSPGSRAHCFLARLKSSTTPSLPAARQ